MAAEGGSGTGGAALRPGLPPAPARPATLAEALERELDRFEPFTALRLLGVGGDDPAAEPEVRGRASNRYAATPLARSTRSSHAVEAAFVGLVGTLGPLPHFYTEAVLREEKRRSGALRGFLDVFVGRLASLFVRAHEKYRLPAAMARRGADGGEPVARAVFALMGLGLPSQRGRLLVRDAHLLPYAGLLAREVRSAAGLEVILADQLDLPVRVEPFRRRLLPISPAEQTRLAAGPASFARLGIDAVAGARTPDASSTFRVVVGPVDYADFMALEPRGRRMAELVELVRLYMDPGLDFDVQVLLRRADVPESRLGPGAPRLGWNGWVRQAPMARDAGEAVYEPGGGSDRSTS
ncbi:type VI secretion system baseplate subunit TssG [Lichenibacterium ramalinae]|uniref:Type VI secretion system baseplate subunit TssG n=1 Tax=Lichenibacterium ramalinae TaxID=2316527 RepID=A0A4Q2R7X3_9HYPH|nr:type VI secretion system baseplate subunit TssG [Lichenibacterium ramalinae]RYB01604.1 type VI secretion system baseplate subunit TssG [Lichenibacterium ramalinae]